MIKHFALILLFLSTAYTKGFFGDDDCRNPQDAERCRNNYLCCDRYNECGDSAESCDPDDGGIPYDRHCYYLMRENQCSDCCIMSERGHYCGTKSECDAVQTGKIIGIVIAVIAGVVFVTLLTWGCFKRHYVKKHIHHIYKESQKYDQHRQQEGGLLGAVQQFGRGLQEMMK